MKSRSSTRCSRRSRAAALARRSVGEAARGGSARRPAERARVRVRERLAGQAPAGPRSPAVAAEFLFQAARFFGDVFGDEVGRRRVPRAGARAGPEPRRGVREDRAAALEAPAAEASSPRSTRRRRSTARGASRRPCCGAPRSCSPRPAAPTSKVIELLQQPPAARAGRRRRRERGSRPSTSRRTVSATSSA